MDLQKLTTGLSRTWAGYLRGWDRSLRAGNHPETTRYNYLLAAAQLGPYLGEHSPDPDADPVADDPAEWPTRPMRHTGGNQRPPSLSSPGACTHDRSWPQDCKRTAQSHFR